MKISIGGIKKDGLKALLSRINKKTAAIIGGAFAAAVAAAVIISVIAAGPGNERAAKKYVESLYQPKYSAAAKNSIWDYEQMIARNAAGRDMTLKEYYLYRTENSARSYGQYLNYRSGLRKNFNEITYGKNYKVEVQSSDARLLEGAELDAEIAKLNKWRAAFNAEDIIDTNKIKEAYSVTVTGRVQGPESGEDINETVTVVKYKGSWRVIDNPVDLLY